VSDQLFQDVSCDECGKRPTPVTYDDSGIERFGMVCDCDTILAVASDTVADPLPDEWVVFDDDGESA